MNVLGHAIADACRVPVYMIACDLSWSVKESLVIPGQWSQCHCFFWDNLMADKCFSIRSGDFLTEEDVIRNWREVEVSDRHEITSLVQHRCFKNDLVANLLNSDDAIWVRKLVNVSI